MTMIAPEIPAADRQEPKKAGVGADSPVTDLFHFGASHSGLLGRVVTKPNPPNPGSRHTEYTEAEKRCPPPIVNLNGDYKQRR